MLRVFKASGEEVLAVHVSEFSRMTGTGEQRIRALDLKRQLQGLCGQPRFRQRLLLLDGQTLLNDATLHEPADVQLILLPFRPTSQEQVHQLWDAAVAMDMSAMEQILQRPQDPDLETLGGSTPMLWAAYHGSVEVIMLLTEACADTDKADAAGQSPLFLAAQQGHMEVVRLLLEAKSDKDKANVRGVTPLSVANSNGHVEVVRLLEAYAGI